MSAKKSEAVVLYKSDGVIKEKVFEYHEDFAEFVAKERHNIVFVSGTALKKRGENDGKIC